jgi:hypothetical protein
MAELEECRLLRRDKFGDGAFEHLGGRRNRLRQGRVRVHGRGRSSAPASISITSAASAIGSPAFGPTMSQPSRRLVASSNRSLVATERQGTSARRPRAFDGIFDSSKIKLLALNDSHPGLNATCQICAEVTATENVLQSTDLHLI